MKDIVISCSFQVRHALCVLFDWPWHLLVQAGCNADVHSTAIRNLRLLTSSYFHVFCWLLGPCMPFQMLQQLPCFLCIAFTSPAPHQASDLGMNLIRRTSRHRNIQQPPERNSWCQVPAVAERCLCIIRDFLLSSFDVAMGEDGQLGVDLAQRNQISLGISLQMACKQFYVTHGIKGGE